MTSEQKRLAKTQEMAACLVRGHYEARIDLADWRLIHNWLHACMYTPLQIEAYSSKATDIARAQVQRSNTLDTVACLVLMPLIGALAFLAWIVVPEPAMAASILTPSACAAGGDVGMLIFGLGVGSSIVAVVSWRSHP